MLYLIMDIIKKNSCSFSLFFSRAFLVAGLLVSALLGWPLTLVSAEDRPPAAASEFLAGPADFDACVRLALRQSPFFTKSALEIEIRRLDEKDSKADYFPSFKATTKYYIAQPNDPNVTDPLKYSFAISTGDYNPLFAHLSLKANKLVTKIATLAHLKVISAGLERLGKAFLQLYALENMLKVREQAKELAQENVRYARERQRLGEVVPMEVQIAVQEAEVATAEQEALIATMAKIREGIKSFLGLKPGQPLQLDVSQARRQTLGDFQPKGASLQDAQSRSFDVRIKQLTKELQSWNVALAKMRFVPSVNVALQSPDPLSLTDTRGAFFSVGLSFPVFEGFKRVRNIHRQKTVLEQFASEEIVKSDELSQKWRGVEDELNTAATGLRVAQAQAELARLKESQAETLYRSGEKDFAVLLAARQARVKAQLEAAKTALDYDLALLTLRHLSGDLVYHYVHENQFQK